MTVQNKIASNATGLRYAEEATIGVLAQEQSSPSATTWVPLEPNSYGDFGGKLTTLARNPINPSRQRKKGSVVDKEANGNFNTDMTQKNLQRLLQGFFYADLRKKAEVHPTSVTVQAGDDTYEVAVTTGIKVGSLVFVTGCTNSANNGLKRVTAVVASTSIAVAETLVNETTPAGALIVVVGFQFAAGDLDVTGTGNLASYTSTAKDLTELGLIPGEWIYVGGDTSSLRFTNAVNNGFKRIRVVAAGSMTVDKSLSTLVNEASTTETVQVFLARCLRNELGTSIKRRTYNLELTLGAPDDSSPSQIQAGYLEGAVPNQIVFNFNVADKVNADLSFVALTSRSKLSTDTLKSSDTNAVKEALEEADMFNTSSDVKRIRLAKVSSTAEAPTALFAFLSELTLTINNNNNPNKAIGVLGAFEVTEGTFQISGAMQAYFSDNAAIQSVENNDDVTIDMVLVKQNAGVVIDLPLLGLGDGRPKIEQDQAIKVPLTGDAGTAAKISSTMDYTLHMQWFDYLPTLAVTVL